MRISAKTKICLIVGDPIEHSLSPLMHNAGYKALGIDAQFVFVGARVKVEDVKYLVKAVRIMGIRGLACTVPHKIEVMKYLDKIDPVAKEIGDVNTVVNDEGVLKGYNTDWIGAVKAIENVASIKAKRVGIIGAGGAARAIGYGLKKKGAELKIFNKFLAQGKKLAKKLKCEWADFNTLSELRDFDIIINATPLGMGKYEGISPVPKEVFRKGQIVMDAVYIPLETKMLKEAKEKGAKTIPGIEMLLEQALPQFTYYTKKKAPLRAIRKALMGYFKNVAKI